MTCPSCNQNPCTEAPRPACDCTAEIKRLTRERDSLGWTLEQARDELRVTVRERDEARAELARLKAEKEQPMMTPAQRENHIRRIVGHRYPVLLSLSLTALLPVAMAALAWWQTGAWWLPDWATVASTVLAGGLGAAAALRGEVV